MAEACVPGTTQLRNSQGSPVTSPPGLSTSSWTSHWTEGDSIWSLGQKNADTTMIRESKEASAWQWRLVFQEAGS